MLFFLFVVGCFFSDRLKIKNILDIFGGLAEIKNFNISFTFFVLFSNFGYKVCHINSFESSAKAK